MEWHVVYSGVGGSYLDELERVSQSQEHAFIVRQELLIVSFAYHCDSSHAARLS